MILSFTQFNWQYLIAKMINNRYIHFFSHICNGLNKGIFKSANARWMEQIEIQPMKNNAQVHC